MSETITPNVVLLIFVIIIVIAIFCAVYFGAFDTFKNTSFHTFIIVLAGLGIVITFLFYYAIVELQVEQADLFILQETGRISTTMVGGLLSEIQSSSSIIPAFTASINPLMLCSSNVTMVDDETPAACTQKYTLSYQIFSLWQDVLLGNKYTEYNQLAYITNFLQRAHSSQLFAQWQVQKLNFNIKSQQFGDLLFQYGLKVEPQMPEAYVAAANKFIADPAFQQLL